MIVINNNIRINFDENNWILEERKVVKSAKKIENVGKERWVALGYYQNIENVMKSILNKKLKNIQEEDLKKWIQTADNVNNEMITICKGIKKQ